MHLRKSLLAILITTGFVLLNSSAMNKGELESSALKNSTMQRNPLSLKMLTALTLIKNRTVLPSTIALELREYMNFLHESCFRTDRGVGVLSVALNRAIQDNKFEIIPDFIEIMKKFHAIDRIINRADLPEERTPLLFAIEKEDLRLAQILLAAGANPNTPWPVTTQAPLLLAVKKGNIPLVELLIKHKADVNQTNKIDGSTPLMEAAAHGQIEIVKILLNNGAKKTAYTEYGACAASFAKNNGHHEVFELVVTPEYLAIVADVKNILGLS